MKRGYDGHSPQRQGFGVIFFKFSISVNSHTGYPNPCANTIIGYGRYHGSWADYASYIVCEFGVRLVILNS